MIIARDVNRLKGSVLMFSVIGGIALAQPACTKARAASDVDKVLTATQIACVDGEAVVALTPAAPDLPEIEAACGIAQGLESLVLQAINTFADQRAKAMVRHAERAHP